VESVPHLKKERLSGSFAYASLACSLSFWLAGALSYLQTGLHLRLPGLGWVGNLLGWQWALFEAFALLLAIVATTLRAKLWRIALPVALLMFLLTMYIMGT
jgi:hypothetical protein